MKKRRLFVFLVVLILSIGSLPVVVLAADGDEIKVNGKNILTAEDNKVQCGDGTAVYDSSSNTLTFTDAEITGETGGYGVESNKALKIALVGENKFSKGISVRGDLEISGKGTLNITTKENARRCIYVRGGNLTIEGVTLDLEAQDLYTASMQVAQGNGNVTIKNANVTSNAKNCAITNAGTGGIITIENSKVAAGGMEGLSAGTGSIRIVSNSEVSLRSPAEYDGEYSYGTTSGSLTITDSEVTASTDSISMWSTGDIDIKNSKIDTESKTHRGIYAGAGIRVSGNSDLEAKGGAMAIEGMEITPAERTLADVWTGTAKDGSDAKRIQNSPFDAVITLPNESISKNYFHLQQHSHSGGNATCHSRAICGDCKQAYGQLNPAYHDGMTEIRNQKSASCTEEGYTGDTYCLGCGNKITEGQVIAQIGHKAKPFAANSATCITDGNIAYWHCVTCDKYFSNEACTEQITLAETVISAKGHGETEIRNAKSATCTEEGYTGDKVCKDCSAVVEYGKMIAKTEHTYKDGTCTVCGAVEGNTSPSEPSRSTEEGNTSPSEPSRSTEEGNTSPSEPSRSTPQTSDNRDPALWFILLICAGLSLIGLTAHAWKKKDVK